MRGGGSASRRNGMPRPPTIAATVNVKALFLLLDVQLGPERGGGRRTFVAKRLQPAAKILSVASYGFARAPRRSCSVKGARRFHIETAYALM